MPYAQKKIAAANLEKLSKYALLEKSELLKTLDISKMEEISILNHKGSSRN